MLKGLTTRCARGTESKEGVNVLLFAGRYRQIKMITPSAYIGVNNKPGGLRAFSDRSSPRSGKNELSLCPLWLRG